MVALTRIIDGEEQPYGLFHVTRTPLKVLREKGLRANALGEYSVHRIILRLQERMAEALRETAHRYSRTHEDYYPRELSLQEQISIAPAHYSGVLLSLTREDALLGLNETCEPNRKARAMINFSQQFEPNALETIARFHQNDTVHALGVLDSVPEEPWHLLRLRERPSLQDGFFSLLAKPFLEVNGIMRDYGRGAELQPVARAIWFNGIIPFDNLDVLESGGNCGSS
ncbi:hypothetical protein BJG93_00620 [Paraburkholderia sprentiae WSM5005]|uniref:Uncharacterized protein n=1 Tax=Paraburkholderia sprentiae WSM5005 TaxID=754502 RepID=A0A1I9YCN7_9BURK|nr:hypothetical protein [Paraburkholderia sprentiae]APA84070.1 hypothetical protein BJG93_00620 [Paraburkholderia sprentiae WSM5005]